MEGDSDTLVSAQRLTLSISSLVFPTSISLPTPPPSPFSLALPSLFVPYFPLPLPYFPIPLPSLFLSLLPRPFPLTSSFPPHFQIRRLPSSPYLDAPYTYLADWSAISLPS